MHEEKLSIGCLDVSFLVGCAGLSGRLFLKLFLKFGQFVS